MVVRELEPVTETETREVSIVGIVVGGVADSDVGQVESTMRLE